MEDFAPARLGVVMMSHACGRVTISFGCCLRRLMSGDNEQITLERKIELESRAADEGWEIMFYERHSKALIWCGAVLTPLLIVAAVLLFTNGWRPALALAIVFMLAVRFVNRPSVLRYFPESHSITVGKHGRFDADSNVIFLDAEAIFLLHLMAPASLRERTSDNLEFVVKYWHESLR